MTMISFIKKFFFLNLLIIPLIIFSFSLSGCYKNNSEWIDIPEYGLKISQDGKTLEGIRKKAIGSGFLENANSLLIPQGIEVIKKDAFKDVFTKETNIKRIKFNSNPEIKFEENAFCNCDGIKELDFSLLNSCSFQKQSVIGQPSNNNNSFYNLSPHGNIRTNDSLSRTDELTMQKFLICNGLYSNWIKKFYEIPKEYFDIQEKDGQKILCGIKKEKEKELCNFNLLKIYDGINEIKENAFNLTNQSNQKIDLPNNLTNIISLDFKETKTLKKIGKNSFENHKFCNGIKLPDSVEIVDENAFCHCEVISGDIEIGKNCKEIRENALNLNNKLLFMTKQEPINGYCKKLILNNTNDLQIKTQAIYDDNINEIKLNGSGQIEFYPNSINSTSIKVIKITPKMKFATQESDKNPSPFHNCQNIESLDFSEFTNSKQVIDADWGQEINKNKRKAGVDKPDGIFPTTWKSITNKNLIILIKRDDQELQNAILKKLEQYSWFKFSSHKENIKIKN